MRGLIRLSVYFIEEGVGVCENDCSWSVLCALSLIPRPLLFVLQFVFSIIRGNRRTAKYGKGLVCHVSGHEVGVVRYLYTFV